MHAFGVADGKYKCDFKFGHYTIAWNNEATLCLDDLLLIVETLPQLSRGSDGTVRNTPAHSKDRARAYRPEAGTVFRDHFLGRYNPVTRLGTLTTCHQFNCNARPQGI